MSYPYRRLRRSPTGAEVTRLRKANVSDCNALISSLSADEPLSAVVRLVVRLHDHCRTQASEQRRQYLGGVKNTSETDH
jgi:hypothetical protein